MALVFSIFFLNLPLIIFLE